MCSKCYNTTKKRKETEEATPTIRESEYKEEPDLDSQHHQAKSRKITQEEVKPAVAESQLSILSKPLATTPPTTETKNITTLSSVADVTKCQHCTKRIGLAGGIKCRCGLKFCSKHRYVDQHNCTYDYKEQAKKELEGKNPKVVAAKIEKI
jgi:hypothetical protein